MDNAAAGKCESIMSGRPRRTELPKISPWREGRGCGSIMSRQRPLAAGQCGYDRAAAFPGFSVRRSAFCMVVRRICVGTFRLVPLPKILSIPVGNSVAFQQNRSEGWLPFYISTSLPGNKSVQNILVITNFRNYRQINSVRQYPLPRAFSGSTALRKEGCIGQSRACYRTTGRRSGQGNL